MRTTTARRMGMALVAGLLLAGTAAPQALAADEPTPHVTKPCPGDQQYYPHTDPTKFWECSNGTAYRFDCPANLWWDINLLTCNYPEHATRPEGENHPLPS